MKAVTASAPGKVILMGEHAAVYGRPALVASLDLRMEAQLSWPGGGDVELDLPQLNLRRRLPWSEVLVYTHQVRKRWEAYAENPSPESFAEVRGSDPAHLVLVALGEAAQSLGHLEPPGIQVKLNSRLPVGSGFGSSAAAAVALVGGYLHTLGNEKDLQRIQALALEVERRQHGFPSGIDTAAAANGGLLQGLRRPDGTLDIRSFQVPHGRLERFSIFDSGPPREDTGTVVAAVRQRFDGRSRELQELLDRMESATDQFQRALTAGSAQHESISTTMGQFQRCLEELGVVPETVCRVVNQLEGLGVAAKISGAGSLTGTGAGSLLVYHETLSSPGVGSLLESFPRLSGSLGGQGLRLETRS